MIKNLPVIGPIARRIYRRWINPPKQFTGSSDYWNQRYETGGSSGDGSYDKLAEFKAEVLNDFVLRNGIKTVIEYGCGDGNQLRLARYPSYLGFDVSPKAVSMCREVFRDDATKSFKLVDDYDNDTAELTLSLDVIYHLVEDGVFQDYMHRLFDSSERFVIVYSSDYEEQGRAAHVRHRKFSAWVETNKSEWKRVQHIPNRFPFSEDTKTGSFAEFFIFERT